MKLSYLRKQGVAVGVSSEPDFKVLVVRLILDGKAEEALKLLSEHYGVDFPKIKVGLSKSPSNALGCYRTKNATIFVLNSDMLKEPSVILHEFYHHLRTSPVDKRHRGTERYATRFAKEFIEAYRTGLVRTDNTRRDYAL